MLREPVNPVDAPEQHEDLPSNGTAMPLSLR